ncbi:hypothetical protein [Pseudomonas sp. GW456-12-10-14-LB2]|uniref:hypothetical protein n=1 Tax=Pseudomonas sp. GW456-12-10-14-LB2 TaxID=2070674 RepID=UPI0011AFC978|nr:hypothetical protein [Pseudomonas sp. GW456-12-10-14-LB2]
MNNTTDSDNNWAELVSGLIAGWEWLERLLAALWNGLGWPHSALIMFCVLICLFKDEIRNVIPRIRKFGTDGFEMESPPQAQQATNEGELQEPPVGDFPHVFGVVFEAVTREIEGKDMAEAKQFLVRDSAGWRVLCFFENIYSNIFGGQIQLLQLLNQRGLAGMPTAEAEREWSAYKERFTPALDDWEMDGFLAFLIGKELIIKSEDRIAITFTGHEFLIWMTKYGRSTNRPW